MYTTHENHVKTRNKYVVPFNNAHNSLEIQYAMSIMFPIMFSMTAVKTPANSDMI